MCQLNHTTILKNFINIKFAHRPVCQFAHDHFISELQQLNRYGPEPNH